MQVVTNSAELPGKIVTLGGKQLKIALKGLNSGPAVDW